MSDNGKERFFKTVEEMLKEIRNSQSENIENAAEVIADSIQNEGVIHTYGAGHSHALAEDVFFRAGTLVPINYIHDAGTSGETDVIKASQLEQLEEYGEIIYEHTRPKKQDCFIIISNSGKNPVGIDLAKAASENDNMVIAITSFEFSRSLKSRHSSGDKLYELADIVIDNCGKFGDIAIEVDWLEYGIGPTSTITGAYILQGLMVEAAFVLKDRGIEPPVFVSSNIEEGMRKNEKYIDKYWSRIRNW